MLARPNLDMAMQKLITPLLVALVACGGGSSTAAEPVTVTEAPEPRLSAVAPEQELCRIGRTPNGDAPSVDVDSIANVVVRSADEARVTIDRHTPPGNDPHALFALAHALTDLYRLEHDEQVLQDAIRTWAQLIQTAPNFDNMDEVLYQLAWGLGAIDQHDRARQVYHRLIRHYPQSPLVVVAYLDFADYFVRSSDGVAARRFYEKAQEIAEAADDSMTLAYVAYGYAWANHVAGESVDPQTLNTARSNANEALRNAIELDWCTR